MTLSAASSCILSMELPDSLDCLVVVGGLGSRRQSGASFRMSSRVRSGRRSVRDGWRRRMRHPKKMHLGPHCFQREIGTLPGKPCCASAQRAFP